MILGLIDTATVAIGVSGLDLVALKKLSLVSHVLAQKIGGSAGEEQTALATILDDVILRIELGIGGSAVMAELIVTDEEKAAASYLAWDDASLGRFAKYTALTLDKLAGDSEGLRKVSALSAAMILVGTAFEANASLTLELYGATHGSVETGDWIVSVRRRDASRPPHPSASPTPSPTRGEGSRPAGEVTGGAATGAQATSARASAADAPASDCRANGEE